MRNIDFVSVSMIFHMDFGTVPTVWNIFPILMLTEKSTLVQPRLFSAVFLALLVFVPLIVSSTDCISVSSKLIDTFSFLYRLCIVHT